MKRKVCSLRLEALEDEEVVDNEGCIVSVMRVLRVRQGGKLRNEMQHFFRTFRRTIRETRTRWSLRSTDADTIRLVFKAEGSCHKSNHFTFFELVPQVLKNVKNDYLTRLR